MVCQTVKFALLLGAIIAVSVSPARADDAVVPAPVPVPVPAATNCGPAMRTITECVPETYVAKKRTYKVVCRTEEYDACKWQCVPEVRQRTCPVVKIVVVQTPETRKVCKLVTVMEKRTTMKTCYKTVKEIQQKRHLVSLGHWETRESLLGGLFRNPCATTADPCGKPANTCGHTYKVWVYCPKFECCPVEVCKRVCFQQPVESVVPVCKRIETNVTTMRCVRKCVTENVCQQYKVNVLKRVHYKATRQVRTCVPEEVDVTCTRMVRRIRQVPCDSGNSCNTCTPACGIGLHNIFAGLFRSNGNCCR